MVDIREIQESGYNTPRSSPEVNANNAYLYKAVGDIGGVVSDVANDLVEKRTKAEASMYHAKSLVDFNMKYERRLDDLSRDPSIDWIRDGGKTINSLQQEMQNESERFRQNAPSNLAATTTYTSLVGETGKLSLKGDSIRSDGIKRGYNDSVDKLNNLWSSSILPTNVVKDFDAQTLRTKNLKAQLNEGNIVDIGVVQQDNKVSMNAQFIRQGTLWNESGRADLTVKSIVGDMQASRIIGAITKDGKLTKPIGIPDANDPKRITVLSQDANGNIVKEIVSKWDRPEGLLLTNQDLAGSSRFISEVDESTRQQLLNQALNDLSKRQKISGFNQKIELAGYYKNALDGNVSVNDVMALKNMMESGAVTEDNKSQVLQTVVAQHASQALGPSVKMNPNMDEVEKRQIAKERATSAWKTIMENPEMLEKNFPGLSEEARAGRITPASFEDQVYKLVSKQASDAMQELNKDPLKYTNTYYMGTSFGNSYDDIMAGEVGGRPNLTIPLDGSSPRVQNLMKGIGLSIAKQREISAGKVQTYFTKEARENIKSILDNSIQEPTRASNLVANITKLYGPDAKNALDEIGARSALLAGTAGSPSVLKEVMAVQSKLADYETEAKSKFPDQNIEEKISTNSKFKELLNARSNGNPVSIENTKELHSVIKNLVFARMQNGDDLSTSIETAIDRFTDGRKIIDADRRWGYGVSTILPKDIDQVTYETFTEKAADKNVVDNLHIRLPDSYVGDATRFNEMISNRGVWISKPDQSGFKLMYKDDVSGLYVDVIHENEGVISPVEFTSSEMKDYIKKTTSSDDFSITRPIEFVKKVAADAFSGKAKYDSTKAIIDRRLSDASSDRLNTGIVGSPQDVAMTQLVEGSGIYPGMSNDELMKATKGQVNATFNAPNIAAGIRWKGYKDIFDKAGLDISRVWYDDKGLANVLPKNFTSLSGKERARVVIETNSFIAKATKVVKQQHAKELSPLLRDSKYTVPSYLSMVDMHFQIGGKDFKNTGLAEAYKKWGDTGSFSDLKNIIDTHPLLSQIRDNKKRYAYVMRAFGHGTK